MGLLRNIQKAAGTLIPAMDPDLRDAKAAFEQLQRSESAYINKMGESRDDLSDIARSASRMGDSLASEINESQRDLNRRVETKNPDITTTDPQVAINEVNVMQEGFSDLRAIQKGFDTEGFEGLQSSAKSLANPAGTPENADYQQKLETLLNAISKAKGSGLENNQDLRRMQAMATLGQQEVSAKEQSLVSQGKQVDVVFDAASPDAQVGAAEIELEQTLKGMEWDIARLNKQEREKGGPEASQPEAKSLEEERPKIDTPGM